MSKAEAEPADSVDVTITATPQSTAYLLAVDQSVLLLKSGNDITAQQVIYVFALLFSVLYPLIISFQLSFKLNFASKTVVLLFISTLLSYI